MARGWTDTATYKRLTIELQNSSEKDFERLAIRLIRLIWPESVRSLSRKKIDQSGIDILVWGDQIPFPVVIQCKGFSVMENEVGRDQIEQCRESIEAFARSGYTAERYILAFNRTGRSNEFRKEVAEELEKLERSGKASKAQLWDRKDIVAEAFEALYQQCLPKLSNCSLGSFRAFEELEQIQWEPLAEVPLKTKRLIADQYGLVASEEETRKIADPCQEILSAQETLAILTGQAGFGKTTAALRLANLSQKQIIYVPAASIPKAVSTTTDFLRSVVSVEDLLTDSCDEDYKVHEGIARVVLAHILKSQDAPILFVIDGLDESIFFNKRGGIQHLINLVKNNIEVPVLMTARSEYWSRKESDFAAEIGSRSGKAPKRHNRIRFIELDEWDEERIEELVLRVKSKVTDEAQRRRLEHLRQLVANGKYAEFYGDIPKRPLFLRFIIDTVLERDPHRVNRAGLFEEWATKKVLRDICNPRHHGGQRVPIALEEESKTTVELSFLAMTKAAALMTKTEDGEVVLLPSCSYNELVISHPRLSSIADPTGVFLNSLLVPLQSRIQENLIGFAHRAFQEYFLARAVVEREVDYGSNLIPVGVREWIEDIIA